MPTITSNHKDLFRTPDTEDKLNLFHLLLNGNELTVTLSLALLKDHPRGVKKQPAL